MLTVKNLEFGLTVANLVSTLSKDLPPFIAYNQINSVQYDLYFDGPIENIVQYFTKHNYATEIYPNTLLLMDRFLSLLEFNQFMKDIDQIKLLDNYGFYPINEHEEDTIPFFVPWMQS